MAERKRLRPNKEQVEATIRKTGASPASGKSKLTTHIDTRVRNRLRILAAENDTTVAEQIEKAVRLMDENSER